MVNLDGLYRSEEFDQHSCFSQDELGFKIIENGTILPRDLTSPNGEWTWGKGGIVDSEGNFVKSSYVIDTQIMETYTPKDEIPFFNTTVVYLAMYFHVWGHCITDEIRRIWFLKTDVYKKNFSSCPIVLNNSIQGGRIIPQFIELLKILEIDLDKVRILDKPARFRKIVFPDDSFKHRMFTNEFVETIEIVRNYAQKNFTKLPQKNIFFHHDKGMSCGSVRFAKYFASKGFAVIKPENFSLKDQLNILANCEKFASTVGSCSHNSVFLKDHTEVLLIPRSAGKLNNSFQIVLDQMHDKNIFYVDSALSVFAFKSNGPFCYLISPQLKKFFGDKGSWVKEDFETFLQHVNWAMERGFEPREISKKYYSEVMRDFIKRLERHGKLIKNFKYIKYLKETFLW